MCRGVATRAPTCLLTWAGNPCRATVPECTKIAHRRSLAIFTADEGIAGNSAARTILTHVLRRRMRFASDFLRRGKSRILGPKNRASFLGSGKIRPAAAENRAILVHSALHVSAADFLGFRPPLSSPCHTRRASTARGAARQTDSQRVSSYTGVQQLHLRVSRYTVHYGHERGERETERERPRILVHLREINSSQNLQKCLRNSKDLNGLCNLVACFAGALC